MIDLVNLSYFPGLKRGEVIRDYAVRKEKSWTRQCVIIVSKYPTGLGTDYEIHCCTAVDNHLSSFLLNFFYKRKQSEDVRKKCVFNKYICIVEVRGHRYEPDLGAVGRPEEEEVQEVQGTR